MYNTEELRQEIKESQTAKEQEKQNKEVLDNKIKGIIQSSISNGINHFQINSFNMLELGRKRTNVQVVDFKIAEVPKEPYVCIMIYAGEKDLTYDNVCMMFQMTSNEHKYVKLKGFDNAFIDTYGLTVSEYNIEEAGFVELSKDEEEGNK